jgi:ketosteroid isomerase-like protein
MTVEDNKRVVLDFLEAGNCGEMDRCVALLGPLFGRLKAGIHMEVHRLVAEGDHVVAVMSGRAETLEGVPFNNQYCWLVRVGNGKMAEVTEFMDTGLVQQVFGQPGANE